MQRMNGPGSGLRSQPPGLPGPAAWAGLTFPPIPQYMMLSGQVPFQGASGQGGQSQAAEIMRKIREGRFSLDGEAWQNVSEEAKELVRGGEPESQILRLGSGRPRGPVGIGSSLGPVSW